MTREQRLVFGEIAEQYDKWRPGYPDELFDMVMSFGSLEAGDRALELGAGTGKATVGFLARGLRVHALEPSPEMAAVLRRQDVAVEETLFETATLEEGAYDLVYAAQSWHWVGGEDRCDRVARVLRPGGVVALFWNLGRPHPEPFKTDNDAIYARLWPENDPGADQWTAETMVADFARGNAFEPLTKRVVTWECEYTSAEWMALLATHSNHRMLPDEIRTQLHREVGACIDKHGGTLPVVYDTTCFLTMRL